MMIFHSKKKINTILNNNVEDIQKHVQNYYESIVNSIDLDSIDMNHYVIQGYYTRKVMVCGLSIQLRITRIRRYVDNHIVTHALLINDLIPFLSITFDDLYNTIMLAAVLFNTSYVYYLINKFSNVDSFDYETVCTFNARSIPVIHLSLNYHTIRI